MTYPASPIKRHRATAAEMEVRAEFLIGYARKHHPVTIRALYYQAEVHGVPGIDKTEAGYAKVLNQVLQLRREGRLPYEWIADSSRYMRKPQTWDRWQDMLEHTARTYRRNLWQDADAHVEVWCEKDALSGVIEPVTWEHDVPLMVSRGFTSETFVFSAVEAYRGSARPLVVYALYDFDRSGQDAARSLREKLARFGAERDVEVRFQLLGLDARQVWQWRLPTRPHKRTSAADKRWPHTFACELDAIPPDDLRDMVREAIELHLPPDQLAHLKNVEAMERQTMLQFIGVRHDMAR